MSSHPGLHTACMLLFEHTCGEFALYLWPCDTHYSKAHDMHRGFILLWWSWQTQETSGSGVSVSDSVWAFRFSRVFQSVWPGANALMEIWKHLWEENIRGGNMKRILRNRICWYFLSCFCQAKRAGWSRCLEIPFEGLGVMYESWMLVVIFLLFHQFSNSWKTVSTKHRWLGCLHHNMAHLHRRKYIL